MWSFFFFTWFLHLSSFQTHSKEDTKDTLWHCCAWSRWKTVYRCAIIIGKLSGRLLSEKTSDASVFFETKNAIRHSMPQLSYMQMIAKFHKAEKIPYKGRKRHDGMILRKLVSRRILQKNITLYLSEYEIVVRFMRQKNVTANHNGDTPWIRFFVSMGVKDGTYHVGGGIILLAENAYSAQKYVYWEQ